MRFVAELEVEVRDPGQAAAYTLGWAHNGGGTVMMSGDVPPPARSMHPTPASARMSRPRRDEKRPAPPVG